MTQLAINRIQLPEDICSIIKNYALPTIERARIMKMHKQICSKIINSKRDIIIAHPSFNRWWFRTEEVSIYCAFCKKCGDYVYAHHLSVDKLCLCPSFIS